MEDFLTDLKRTHNQFNDNKIIHNYNEKDIDNKIDVLFNGFKLPYKKVKTEPLKIFFVSEEYLTKFKKENNEIK